MCQAITKMMPRIRETELEAWIRLSFAKNAAECCAFESIVAVDDHALDRHHTPTTRPINNRILVDIGARKAFYCADMTRTWATGVPTQEFQWMLDAVKDRASRGVGTVLARQEAVGCREGCAGKLGPDLQNPPNPRHVGEVSAR